jgi:large subunit ribosomal protein L18
MRGYVPLQRRRREGVTDYRSRKRAIASQKPLLVVRFSSKNVTSQFVAPKVKGDVVVSSAHSKELAKVGWKGSAKSTPASYLLGLIAGKKALQKGIREAVLYNGLAPFTRGSRVAAFLKGVVDAGVAIPAGEAAYPADDRLAGKSIADYASKLSAEDKQAYLKKFSGLLKAGFKPEDYPNEFERTKSAILGASK